MKRKELPKRYREFSDRYPEIAAEYEKLGSLIHGRSTLDARTRALVKLALAVGARMEGGVHAQVRKALAAGVKPDELRQVGLLSITTIGFPAAMAAMSWIDDLLPRKLFRRRS
jgi:alkylhydroperoxidase/carboxymuconolactone decarboxylase family protein YurZ